MPPWVAKEKMGTLLLASEMPVPIPRSRTVHAHTHTLSLSHAHTHTLSPRPAVSARGRRVSGGASPPIAVSAKVQRAGRHRDGGGQRPMGQHRGQEHTRGCRGHDVGDGEHAQIAASQTSFVLSVRALAQY